LFGFLGCGDGATAMMDAAMPPPATVGHDLDERTPRELSIKCKLPQPFYDALAGFSVTPQQLALPDWGLTFSADPNRFHWTDEIRHQGDLAPDFACMVAADVQAAI